MKRPVITVLAGRSKRVEAGHPWAYSNEIQMDQQAKALKPGTLVRLRTEGGVELGVATFNPHTLIAARCLEPNPQAEIDAAWFAKKFSAALALRGRLIDAPFYRLVHAEADGLPGLIVDRHGDVITLQANTAGMDALLGPIVEALTSLFAPRAILLNRHGPAVVQEGLTEESRVLSGAHEGPLQIQENGLVYSINALEGQKTGWFYDQRDNRAFAAKFAKDARVFDGYCYAGGFGLLAAKQGAKSVRFVDAAAPALALAEASAKLHGSAERCTFTRGDVLDVLTADSAAKTQYELVIVDPPAFIKAKKDLHAGLRGYTKLARLAAQVVTPGGVLCICTCSHHAEAQAWSEAVVSGIYAAGRRGRIIRSAGAGIDHPVHPLLPESAYLKSLVFVLD